MHSPRRSQTRAFTVIEALIALVIILLAFLTMTTVVPISFNFASRDSQRVQAVAAGQVYLDQLRFNIQSNGDTSATPAPPTIAIDPGDSYVADASPAPSLGNFGITSACPLVSGSTYRWDCTVTVTWNDPSGNPRTAKVESYVTAQK